MSVGLRAPQAQDLLPVPGVTLGWAQAGIRKANRKDLLLIELVEGSTVAGVFTRNRFCAAPVLVCQDHLASAIPIRALVVNTGVANAGTGETGLAHSRATCDAVATLVGCEAQAVLPFSTGVIMEPLPIERLVAGLPQAHVQRSAHHWLQAAETIMTTDTLPKAASRTAQIDGVTVTLTGISKGAGMIRPNMATMLGFIATDTAIALEVLQSLVRRVADASFNRITIDGDTSTNDSFVVMATHQAPMAPITRIDDPRCAVFEAALTQLAQHLAQAIVRDGEGATKFIEVLVEQAGTEQEAQKVAYAIAHSPLVKTAFFASDPNLGRILAAVGYAGIDDLDQTHVQLYLNDVWVARNGARHPDYQEADGKRVMQGSEITVRVVLGRGHIRTTVWTCDLSHEYVSINADYRS